MSGESPLTTDLRSAVRVKRPKAKPKAKPRIAIFRRRPQKVVCNDKWPKDAVYDGVRLPKAASGGACQLGPVKLVPGRAKTASLQPGFGRRLEPWEPVWPACCGRGWFGCSVGYKIDAPRSQAVQAYTRYCFASASNVSSSVSYTHLTLPTNREV